MAAQVRAIETGREAITADLLQSAYRDDFRLVNHILETLKSGDISPIHKVEDVLPPALQPIHSGINADVENNAEKISDTRVPKALETGSSEGEVKSQMLITSLNLNTQPVSGRDSIGFTQPKTDKGSKKRKKNIIYEEADLRRIVSLRKEEHVAPST